MRTTTTELHTSTFQASPLQQGLWKRLSAGGPATAVQCRLLVDPAVEPARLATALDEVVRRHEALRTTLVEAVGGVAQVIHPTGPALATVSVDESGDVPARQRYRREREGLDPIAGPTFRALLVTTPAGPAELVLTAHPAVADREALRLVARELVHRYAEPGNPADPPPLQYADFAAWHHDILTGDEGAGERRAWAGHLAELAPAAPPSAAPPGAGPDETRVLTWHLDAGMLAALDSLAASWAVSVRHLLGGLCAVVGGRFQAGSEVVVELADPARHQPATRQAVGPFARTVPVRCDIRAEAPLVDVVRQLAEAGQRWAERIDYLDPGRTAAPAGQPRIGFEYDDAPAPMDGADLTFRVVAESTLADAADPALPVRLSCRRRDDRLEIRLGYRTAALPANAAAAFGECLLAALSAAVDRPEPLVGQLRVLPDEQRHRILARGRGEVVGIPDTPVHESIAAQASRTPDAVAVAVGDAELTYRELDERADRLAGLLGDLGVAPGDHVVISLDRSAELLVAVLGVLKAGAVFVPVDPAYPRERLAYVLSDTGAQALIGSAAHRAANGSGAVPARHVLLLDEDLPLVAARPAAPRVRVGPDDPAYVLYTSGTTGVPNGVLVAHGGLANYLHWCADSYDMSAGTGVLTHSSISFDFTLTTLLGPLLTGQRVVMLPGGTGIAGLAAVLRSARDLTLVKLTPTHLDALGQLLTVDELTGAVRTLVVGGEALDARAVAAFRAAGVRVVNEYGPTETVVGSVAYTLEDDSPRTGPVPVGRPIANTVVYLLGPDDAALVPDGAVGEVYLGGAGVAIGYLHRPELTARRFGPEPDFGTGGRMYRTGDLARWLPDGNLGYLGRVDEQVKIQGVRVEPAEVEAVLLDCAGVARAAVVVRRDEDPGNSSPLAGTPTLVAYVVPERTGDGARLDAAALDRHCRHRLPEQLVPRAFVTLDALPMTVNGKLDRAALPKPDVRLRRQADLVPPRTEAEEILAGAIAQVLGLDAVGIDDNYFVLGGDSIRSVMVTSRAQARGVDVTVADLHAHPTVRDCAEYLRARSEGEPAPTTRPFSLISAEDRARVPEDVEDAFPLNLLQEGMIFHRDFAAKSAVYHAIASIRLRAPYDHDVMRMTVTQLVERHPMLRTSFDMTTFSQPMQLVHARFESPLHLEDLRELPLPQREERVRRWIDGEKARGFELHEYPLIRFMVQRLTDEEWQFTYGFHHEIVDGWSEALMIAELFSHYFSTIYDEPIALRAPSSTMRDAVALELAALRDRSNYEFWERYLADATMMRLPRFDGTPVADKGAREIVRIEVPVPVELSDRLKQVALTSAMPMKNVLMAAHLAVMSAYGGHADTLTYTVGNGRPESADGSSAIGLFVNSLALRVRTTGGTWRELMAAGLESERASMPYRRLPMAELKRHQGNEPLAETLFFFTNYHVFGVLDRWTDRGVSHVATDLYGESTFPFCAIFRLNRETGHLEVRLEYDSLQFSTELMDGVRDSYAEALTALAADPDSRYDTRSFAPPRDQARLREVCWGPAGTADGRRLHDLVDEQARRRPDAPAVWHDGAVVTYRELVRRANRLAHLLRAGGAGPERVVGVLAERSIEQIVALLAVLKSGGAYLPLDPVQPDERIRAVLDDAGCDLLLAQERLAGRAPAGVRVVAVDPALSVAAGYPGTAPSCTVGPDNPAYVIYTSGSTGQPKGVVVAHRNVVAATLARRVGYPAPVGRYLLLSSFAFDSSVAGIFWTLADGGTLLLPPEGAQREPAHLLDLIRAERPSHTLGVPSLLKLLLDQATPGQLDSLRVVISAGESCPAELARGYAERLPGRTFVNEYGPTETTVWATGWFGVGGLAPTGLQAPIGRPVAGARVVPLNHHRQLVPVGVSGQLHVGGAGVARCYLGRAAETAEKFLPDPFADRPGARCYATGDIGRVLPSGDLEFQGRTDHQIKIQGFRVELGGIEALLDAHPAIQRSIVLARGEGVNERVLVAYLLPEPGQAVEPDEVRQYVRDRLPRYLVPAAVVILESLPLTPTGKVDRAALPPPSAAQLAGTPRYTAPRTDVERTLAAIWCKVLQLDRVGVHDRFFDIGGESLRAMQVIAETNKVFRIGLSVRRLFDAPTIGELAAEVGAARSADGPAGGAADGSAGGAADGPEPRAAEPAGSAG
ncbi:amino acid adenylation domain-containing protein [Plantactinospora sp. CA-294935]|uniref:amino acid adenylation domain-containing protein n=1 Tax=Plantactinospora sp. CA-294935 TaxID=3240012 RepID=UPI003D8A9999